MKQILLSLLLSLSLSATCGLCTYIRPKEENAIVEKKGK